MPKVILLNSSDYTANSGNTYTYSLPQNYKSNVGDQIGVSSDSMYNSTFNITASRGNNTIQLIWNSAIPVTYNLTIPDGYYSVSDINFFL